MAIGFKLSNVLSFELTPNNTVLVTTRHIVYEIDFDDGKRAEEFCSLIAQLTSSIKKKEKAMNGSSAQKRKSFYLEESKNNEFEK